jgi:hypothetical protein
MPACFLFGRTWWENTRWRDQENAALARGARMEICVYRQLF